MPLFCDFVEVGLCCLLGCLLLLFCGFWLALGLMVDWCGWTELLWW